MSAIGNFDVVDAPDVMIQSYGALFARKLSLNGVDPASMSQQVGKSTFAAINGHRDAGKTACPGRYLYAKIPTIRSLAAAAAPAAPPPPPPLEISDPAPQSNLVGAGYPDPVVRRASDGRALILPTGGLTSFSKATVSSAKGWSKRPEVLVSPDLTGDGVLDPVSTSEQGVLRIRPGKGNGKFKATSKVVKTTKDHTLMTAVGDINKDGRNDSVARHKGRMVALLGTGKGGFKRDVLDKGMGSYSQFIGVGDQNGDGANDVFARDAKGRLFQYAGTGSGTFGAPLRRGGVVVGVQPDHRRCGLQRRRTRRPGRPHGEGQGLHPPRPRRRLVLPADRSRGQRPGPALAHLGRYPRRRRRARPGRRQGQQPGGGPEQGHLRARSSHRHRRRLGGRQPDHQRG
ncbi:FG-GAP-like repeat-containing protein [Nocardioides sp. B-3]|uniref:FG-GAP-like repeat-containing protein n=1 Tax=Nocardioides sp. B-3 TaxID=2895565 RepID=UPI002153A2A4|nr:FG-GAP-like repeat-containing protein [Nocardioides sp. B-3]UUZ58098.1 hypothetical protein LP418_17655 [Nocardioides sp. B-3]